jgi:hypothetical protein
MLDFSLTILMILFLPILLIIIPNKTGLISNILEVLIGKKSWVGYKKTATNQELPKIKKGVLSPADSLAHTADDLTILRLNQLYAKDYKVNNDLQIILNSWKQLGKRS